MRRVLGKPISSVAILAALCALLLSFIPLAASAQTATSSLLVKLAVGLSPDQQALVIARNGGIEISSIPALRLHVIQVVTGDLPQVLANYKADPQVVNAEENQTRQSQAFPADPLYQNQWSLPKIGWDQIFGTVTPTGSAIVAILDTGVDAQHPDLAANVIPGTSILDGSSGTTDPSGHGTWVAGIAAAQTNTLEGIAGVAYAGVRIMPVTVLDANGLGQDSDIIAGVIWAADHGADVILMAFSNPGFSQNLQDAIDYAWSKNVVLVAATGNDGVNTPTFPAGDRGVMGVSGTDLYDNLVAFSNYGPSVFIAAPATDIQTTDIGDAYTVINGTSASAAIVAGAAAFMKAVDPTLTNGIIVGRLARNADPAGTQYQTGNGRINMPRALADTNTDFIEPAGAPPTGNGGPFVGPYRAAAKVLGVTFAGTGAGTVVITDNTDAANNKTCNATCTDSTGNNDVGILTASAGTDSVFAGWSAQSAGVTGCSANTCNFSMGNQAQSVTATFNAVPPTKLAITSVNGGANPTAGTAFSVVVQSQAPGGTPSKVITATAVTLSLNAGTGTLSGTLSGTILAGQISVTISGVVYSKAESPVILTASRNSGDNLAAGDSAPFTVNPGSAAKLAFIPGPFTVAVNQCSPAIAVQAQDANGNPANVNPARTIALSSNSGGGVFYSNSTCTTPLSPSQTTIANNGNTSASFFYKDGSAGTPTLTGHNTSGGGALTDATQVEIVNKRSTSTAIAFSTNPLDVSQSTTATVTVTDTDAGTQSSPGVGTIVNVTSDSGDTITGTCTLVVGTSSTSTCSVTVTPTTVTGGHNISATFAATAIHQSSSATSPLTVHTRSTSTTVSLSPSSVDVNQPSTVNVTVTDTDANGTKVTPTGTVGISVGVGGDPVNGTCTLSGAGGTATCSVTVTPQVQPGTHTVTATFSATSVHSTSTDTKTLTVTIRSTSTTVTLTPSTVDVSQPSTVGITVTDTDANGSKVTPTGTVGIAVGVGSDVVGGTCNLAQGANPVGTATCSVTVTPQVQPGTHTVTATFSATNVHSTSTDTKTLTVNARSTSTTVILTPSTVDVNQASTVSVTLTDTDANGSKVTPTGTVGIAVGVGSDVVGGTCVLAQGANPVGTATCSVTVTPQVQPGTHTVTATFSATNVHSTSADTKTLTVNARSTSTSVSLSPSTVDVNQTSTVTVTVTDTDASGGKVTPTGTVGVSVGVGTDVVTGTCLLSQSLVGTATCSVTVTPQVQSGTHTVTASFSATAVHTGSGDTKTLIVKTRPTSTSVSLSPSTVDVNQTSTVTVTVMDIDANGTKVTPTGTVGISVGVGTDVVVGTCTLGQTVLGTATCAVTVTPQAQPGTHTVAASFNATDVHSTSTDTKTLIVNTRSTSTTVSLSPSTVDVNQASTVTVTVMDTDANGTKVTPTGTVGISVGVASDAVTGTCNLSQTVLGAATCVVSVTPAQASGVHTVTTTFSSTAVHTGSSDTKTLTVNTRSTATSVTLTPATVVTGQASTVAVTVNDTDLNGTKLTPVGTVGISVGVGADVVAGTCALTQTVLGTATCSVTITPTHSPGTHTVTASFSATDIHSGSTNTQTLTVNPADTTTTITSDLSAPTKVGQAYTVQWSVTINAPGAGTPTGNVTVSDGTDSCSASVATGQCSITSTTPGFPKTITVTYPGDPDFNTSFATTTHVVDDPPVSTADVHQTTMNQTLTVNAPGVLYNDRDVDAGQTITAVLVGGPSDASAFNLNSDGSFTYTPNTGFTGTDSFTYQATDGIIPGNTVTVTIEVLPAVEGLVSRNDAYVMATNDTLIVAAKGVLLNDNGENLSAVLETGPAHGTLTLNPDGSFTYVPTTGFTGVDTFFYRAHGTVNNVATAGNLAMVEIKVGGATQAINDYYLSTDGSVNTSLSGLPGVLANDTPPGSLQASLIVGPLYGTLQQNSNGSFVYTPNANYFEGTDSFIYRATNSGYASNFAMVTIRRPNISVDAPTVTYGDDATVTVTVTFPGLGPAAGNVSLSAANASVAAPATATLDVNGQATFTITQPTAAQSPHALTATYTNTSYSGSSTGSGSLTVNKATPLITWANPADITYGTALGATQLDATATFKGNPVPGSFLYTPAAGTVLNAGPNQNLHVLFTPTDTGNFNTASKDVSINVSKAPLTVTADNQTKTFGDPDPTFSVSYSGFVNGEGPGALAGSLTFNFAGKPPTSYGPSTTVPVNAGTYAVRPSGLTNNNYLITFQGGTYTINTAPLTITPDGGKSKFYGQTFTAFTGQVVGLKGSDEVTVTYTSTGAPAAAGAGSYDITVYTVTFTSGSAANYAITENTATNGLTVNKAPLTVTANDKTKVYFGPDPMFDVSYVGFVNNEGPGVLGGTLAFNFAGKPPTSYGPSMVVPTDAGTYAIRPSGLTSNNYDIAFKGGTYTINKAPSATVVTFEAGPYVYRASAFTATAVVTGVGGLNSPVAVVYSGDCTNVTAANGCTATATYGGDTNHFGSSDTKSITITQAPSTTVVTFEAGPYVYRATAFTATAQVTGVGGLNSPVAVVYSGDCMNVTATNGCTATATFAGDQNHLGSNDSKSITITQAPSATVVAFEAGPYVYRGTPFTATAVVTGVGGLNSPVPVVYSGDCTNVTAAYGCTATATYAGDTNHLGSSNSKSITITKASSTTVVTFEAGPYVYRSTPFVATAQVAGVGGLSSSVSVVYSGDCTNVTATNGCTATATYGGDSNHLGSSDSKSITITPASSATVVTFENGPYVYRGSPFTATAVVTGVGGLNSPVTPVIYSGDCTNVTGANGCTATATYNGDTNHLGSTDSKSVTITKANSTVTAVGNTCVFAPATPCPGTGSAKGVQNEDLGPVNLAYKDGHGNPLPSAPTNAGTYQVAARFLGNTNYDQGQSTPATITISKAPATLALTNLIQIYSGFPEPVTVTTDPAGLVGVSATYNGSSAAPTAAGSYAVVATLTNDNYVAAPASGTLAILQASAGADQTVNEGDPVTMSGTGYGVTYLWTQVSPASPVISISGASSLQANFSAPPLPGGFGSTTFTFQLAASDDTFSTSSTTNVTVKNVNHAPIAFATAPAAVAEGTAGVTLDGSTSYDPDGDPITYSWVQTAGPSVSLAGANTKTAAFTAPILAGGVGGPVNLTFQLTVSDSALAGSYFVTVAVDQVDHAPTANAGSNQTVNVATLVTLDGSLSSDPDNDPILSYTWTQTAGPTVTLNTSNPAKPTFMAPNITNTTPLTFSLVVSDGVLSSTNTAQVTITVVNENLACNAAAPSIPLLWPPDHRMVPVSIVGLADPAGVPPTITITKVTSDEPTNGLGDGDTAIDAVIQSNGSVLLRAERSGNGDGRVYTITYTATTPLGIGCINNTIKVGVPHDQGKGATPIDSGFKYDATK